MKSEEHELFEMMQEKIKLVQEVNSLRRNVLIITEVRHSLRILSGKYDEYKFQDEEHQIGYYKNVWPKFNSLFIFYTELYNLEKAIQFLDASRIESYYTDELKLIESFFSRNQFHYQYYCLNASELDQLYFVHGSDVQSPLVPEIPEPVQNFTTNASYLFSKFIAYENLRTEIQSRIANANSQPQFKTNGGGEEQVTWTGDSINLVEIAFGIYLTGQLNHGNISLSRVVRWLEQRLNITIGLPHRRFDEIARRKRISPTRFIDQMREALIKKITGN